MVNVPSFEKYPKTYRKAVPAYLKQEKQTQSRTTTTPVPVQPTRLDFTLIPAYKGSTANSFSSRWRRSVKDDISRPANLFCVG
jgi:hypothetical protein